MTRNTGKVESMNAAMESSIPSQKGMMNSNRDSTSKYVRNNLRDWINVKRNQAALNAPHIKATVKYCSCWKKRSVIQSKEI